MKRDRVAIWLDASMLAAVGALEVVAFTGLVLHEWLGAAIVAAILVHLLLQWPWIASRTRRLTAPRAGRGRTSWILNFALFACMVAAIVSGIAVSRHMLPTLGLAASTDGRWEHLHNVSVRVLLALLGFHLALNWDWVASYVRRLWHGRRSAAAAPAQTVIPSRRRPWRLGRLAARTAILAGSTAVLVLLSAGLVHAMPQFGRPGERRELRRSEARGFAVQRRGREDDDEDEKPDDAHPDRLGAVGAQLLIVAAFAAVGRKVLRLRL